MGMFFEEHAKLLSDFARVSQSTGARADYVQGGGGNTSVKLPGGLMAIKASGFCLSDIRPDKAYAVLDGADLRNFYLTTDPSALADVEKEGSARAKADVRHIDGLADLRPSVEAGFHSILKTFVVHTHSVYANLAACSTACRPIAAQAFAGANYTWGWVPYTDPGARLTFSIRDELARVEKETGKRPEMSDYLDHVDYIANLIGIDHIGFGGDSTLDDNEDKSGIVEQATLYAPVVEDYNRCVGVDPAVRHAVGVRGSWEIGNVIEAMRKRGYSDQDIGKFTGGNFIRVLKANWK